MNAAELWARLSKTIEESLFASGAGAESIQRDDRLEMLGDELDMLELVMSIEEEFGFEIDDDEIQKWKTVGDIERYLTEAMVS